MSRILAEDVSAPVRRAYWVNIAAWVVVLILGVASRITNYPRDNIIPISALVVIAALAYLAWSIRGNQD